MIRGYMTGLAVLRETNFRRFFIGNATSLLGDGMVPVALAFAVLDLTGSPADLGYVLASRTIPMIAVVLVGGVIADRLPRRGIMVAADLARFLSQAIMAAMLISGHAWVMALMALQAVQGVGAGLFTPAAVGLMPLITSSPRLQNANALRGMALSFGTTVGPAMSGVLVAAAGPGWAIALDSLTYAFSAVMLTRLRLPAHVPPQAQSILRDFLTGWHELRTRSWVWAIIVLSAAVNMLFPAFMVLGPAVARESLGGPTAWATILAAFGAGSVLGGLVVLRLRPRRPLLFSVLVIALLPLPIFGIAAHLPAYAVAALALVAGIGNTSFNTVWETTLQQNIPNESLSRVSAYDWFASFACQPIGQATAGLIAAAIGIYPWLWVTALAQVAIIVSTLGVPSIRRLPALRPAAEASAHKGSAASP